MKKIFITLTLSAFTFYGSFAQMAGKLMQGTLKPGSTANSVKAVLKSSATFSGSFSNVQFTFQIPNTVSPQPVVSIKNNPLSANIPTANYVTQVTNEGGFYNYLFAAVPTASPAVNFVAGTEIDALEVEAFGTYGQIVNMRLASLANGGSTGQLNFYIEIGGNDNTNETAMFYGTSNTNGGSYSSYSYVAQPNVTLPLSWLSFSASKQNGNALIKWEVANQVNNDYYEVEMSKDGRSFTSIGKVAATDKTVYTFSDLNFSKLSGSYVYYRIKQVDKDGRFVYSEVKKLIITGKDFAISIIGNPIKGSKLNLGIQSFENNKGTLKIVDLSGKQVYQAPLSWSLGYTQQTIDLPYLANGTYLANLIVGDEQYQVKFVK